ncbi:MAG: cyclic nucleotide-binding domain-containing protein [Myxococcales bacterium]|nr:cyclic nucleotide-binding domain-containing protein [Myxococcales bacterium]
MSDAQPAQSAPAPELVDLPVEEIIEHLSGSDLFSDLSHEQLRRLVAIGRIERYKRNQHIFKEGDAGDSFCLVIEGAVRISRQVPGMGEEALVILRPGSGFGEMSLIEDAPRSADAIAHETTLLFVAGIKGLEELLFVDRVMAADLLWKLIRILSKRLRSTTDKMTFLSVTGKF